MDNMATVSPLTWIGRLNLPDGHLSVTFPSICDILCSHGVTSPLKIGR